jgi:serine/threonine protein kinase
MVGDVRIEPGQQIGGKYVLERLLGQGSMGQVWRARHATLDGLYAVKLIDVRTVPDAAGRFQMEAHIAAKLSKKTRHIVAVTDHGEQHHHAYLVMELLEGESLEQRIKEAAPLGLGEVSAIVTQVARALKHAHAEGFIHRDLKPGNVFLTKDEDGRVVVKLLDFGIARSKTRIQTRSPFATAKDTLVGTPSYMSPEQTLGLDDIDHRCDLWALAVVAYEALTRQLPFEGETIQDVLIAIGIGRQIPIRQRRPELPEAIEAFYDRAFADALDDRFSAGPDLATAFARAAGVGPSDRPSMAPPLPMARKGPAEGENRKTRTSTTAPVASKRPPVGGDSGADIVLPMQRGVRREVWIAIGVAVLLGIGALAIRASSANANANANADANANANANEANANANADAQANASAVPPAAGPSSASAAPPIVAPPDSSAIATPRASSRAPSSAIAPAPLASATEAAPSVPSVPSVPSAPSAEEPRVAPASAPDAPPPVTPAPARSVDRGEVF